MNLLKVPQVWAWRPNKLWKHPKLYYTDINWSCRKYHQDAPPPSKIVSLARHVHPSMQFSFESHHHHIRCVTSSSSSSSSSDSQDPHITNPEIHLLPGSGQAGKAGKAWLIRHDGRNGLHTPPQKGRFQLEIHLPTIDFQGTYGHVSFLGGSWSFKSLIASKQGSDSLQEKLRLLKPTKKTSVLLSSSGFEWNLFWGRWSWCRLHLDKKIQQFNNALFLSKFTANRHDSYNLINTHRRQTTSEVSLRNFHMFIWEMMYFGLVKL